MQQGVRIVKVTDRKDLKKFIKFPWKIYKNDPNWVPPLIMDRLKFLNSNKNPFFRHNPADFFLAYKNGELVGRIAAIINYQHNEYHNDKVGFFGFLEAIHDRKVFEALLNTAKDWLRQYDRESMMGPMNPSTNDEIGFLIDGYDTPPFFMMPHNPPYYHQILTDLGYEKAKDVYAYFIDEDHLNVNPKLQRVSDSILKKYPIKVRPINIKDFDTELEIVRAIYNDAWSRNWGFVPMTPDEFDFIANDFKKIIDPELALVAEYKGEPVGFSLSLPNYNEVFIKIRNGRLFPFGLFIFLTNKSRIKGIRVITLGIKQNYQHLGLGSIFYMETIRRGLKRGFTQAEMSWILEDNELMNRAMRLLDAKVYKTYRLYQTPL